MVSCQKGPTRHAYAWLIGPFWQDALELTYQYNDLWLTPVTDSTSPSTVFSSQLVTKTVMWIGRKTTIIPRLPYPVPPRNLDDSGQTIPVIDRNALETICLGGRGVAINPLRLDDA